jgi:hypothetical protein
MGLVVRGRIVGTVEHIYCVVRSEDDTFLMESIRLAEELPNSPFPDAGGRFRKPL